MIIDNQNVYSLKVAAILQRIKRISMLIKYIVRSRSSRVEAVAILAVVFIFTVPHYTTSYSVVG